MNSNRKKSQQERKKAAREEKGCKEAATATATATATPAALASFLCCRSELEACSGAKCIPRMFHVVVVFYIVGGVGDTVVQNCFFCFVFYFFL